MNQRRFVVGLTTVFGLFAVSAGCGSRIPGIDPNVYVVEHTDYNPPKPINEELTDDKLEDKQTSFLPDVVDRRPLEEWLVNQSEAVIRLDVPLIKPDDDQQLLVLHPSYAAAASAIQVLPSVNLVDGKAKQFDDGLYAAIDLALFQGITDGRFGHITLVKRLLAAVQANSPSAAYLAAGLTLGGVETHVANDSERLTLIRRFEANPALSKPIGFYTWNDSLKRCWQFMRYFQEPLDETNPIVADLVKAIQADPALAADCQQSALFFAKLTNPLSRLTVPDLIGVDLTSKTALAELRARRGVKEDNSGASLFPASTSRETELFNKLFPLGIPAGTDLMKTLIRRIRSGEVDLTPRESSGWYDHQVYALETMLLPERGEEQNKLLLTKPYKKRMLEAFQALITKRRETHVRQKKYAGPKSAAPPRRLETISPRLRIEPCPSFYLRTARSYSFLQSFLLTSLGEETLKQLHGLRKEGDRPDDLFTELAAQRDLFYGLYLASCDDIGHTPVLKSEELPEPDRCYESALAWLNHVVERTDPDLAQDTRVAVPIYVDRFRQTTRLWVTLGVRLTRLEASYVRPPRIKPANGTGDWEVVQGHMLKGSDYLIAVDEFAEVEISTLSPPTREELREICDTHKTKEKIIQALSVWNP
ncbi:MAG: hypothetical protein WCJ09_00535 [Planctomycetota bacterium]